MRETLQHRRKSVHQTLQQSIASDIMKSSSLTRRNRHESDYSASGCSSFTQLSGRRVLLLLLLQLLLAAMCIDYLSPSPSFTLLSSRVSADARVVSVIPPLVPLVADEFAASLLATDEIFGDHRFMQGMDTSFEFRVNTSHTLQIAKMRAQSMAQSKHARERKLQLEQLNEEQRDHVLAQARDYMRTRNITQPPNEPSSRSKLKRMSITSIEASATSETTVTNEMEAEISPAFVFGVSVEALDALMPPWKATEESLSRQSELYERAIMEGATHAAAQASAAVGDDLSDTGALEMYECLVQQNDACAVRHIHLHVAINSSHFSEFHDLIEIYEGSADFKGHRLVSLRGRDYALCLEQQRRLNFRPPLELTRRRVRGRTGGRGRTGAPGNDGADIGAVFELVQPLRSHRLSQYSVARLSRRTIERIDGERVVQSHHNPAGHQCIRSHCHTQFQVALPLWAALRGAGTLLLRLSQRLRTLRHHR